MVFFRRFIVGLIRGNSSPSLDQLRRLKGNSSLDPGYFSSGQQIEDSLSRRSAEVQNSILQNLQHVAEEMRQQRIGREELEKRIQQRKEELHRSKPNMKQDHHKFNL